RVDLHVVVDPERLEPGVLRPLGHLDRSPPCGRGIDPEVFAIASLGHRQAQLHPPTSPVNAVSTSSRMQPRWSSVAATTSATVNHRPTSRTYDPSVRSASPTSSQVTPIASGRM